MDFLSSYAIESAYDEAPDYGYDEYDGMMDVFTDDVLDDDDLTGGDWYAMALSASHGGAAIHGVSFAPSCEVLAKTSFDFAKKHAVGWVKMDDSRFTEESVTDGVDGILQNKAPFRGIKTTSHIDVLTETAGWESSNAVRAKNAAIVAATAESFGTDKETAKSFAEACAGCDIDDAIVESLLIPVSALKRDAASLGKANHTVYSRGTNQGRITWSDSSLHADSLPPNASLDWARVTATARYIAELNSQLDPNFITAASRVGVPYALIKGSWAFVSTSDYAPMETDWGEIRDLGAKVPGVPSLDQYYDNAKADTHAMLVRSIMSFDKDSPGTVYEAMMRALSSVPIRHPGRHTRITTGTDLYASVKSHKLDAASAAAATKDAGTAWQSFTRGYMAVAFKDGKNEVADACREVVVAGRSWKLEEPETDIRVATMLKAAVAEPSWVWALQDLASLLTNARTAEDRLRRLYRNMTSSSATWEHPPRVGPVLIKKTRVQMLSLAKACVIGKMPPRPTMSLLGNPKALDSVSAFSRLLTNARKFLDAAKMQWAARYNKLANLYGEVEGEGNKKQAVLFGAAAKAMAELRPELLAEADAGFILPSAPKTSYLWLMAVSYIKKRHKTVYLPVMPKVSNAAELAEMLDRLICPEVTFAECEAFARSKVALLAKDIADGIEAPVPPEEAEPEKPKPAAPAPPVMDMEAKLRAMMAMMSRVPATGGAEVVTQAKVERSYPQDVDIDAYARANGYRNFDEAYEDLGDRCAYDLEGEFCRKAITALARQAQAAKEADSNDGIMFGN